MSKANNFAEFSIDLSCPGYGISDSAWEETGTRYMACWKQICASLSTYEAEAFGASFHLTFDWSQMPRQILRMHRAYQRLERAKDDGKDPLRAARFPRTPARIRIQSNVNRELDHKHRHNAVIVSRLHDIFLIANLSVPGAGDFYRIVLRDKSQPNDRLRDSLALSGFYFNLAFLDSHEGKWPFIKILPVSKVGSWFSSIRTGHSQVPNNSAEKVLFALLHLSMLDMSPVAVLWIFFALETLFETRTGENLRVLTERIQLLLSPDEKQRKYLKKQLRELYDLRSALVHGGFDLFHPMMHEGLDKRIDAVHSKWMRPTEFGFRVLLVSLQSIIERGIKWPKFSERLEGDEYAL